jgi:hypothetical protein
LLKDIRSNKQVKHNTYESIEKKIETVKPELCPGIIVKIKNVHFLFKGAYAKEKGLICSVEEDNLTIELLLSK